MKTVLCTTVLRTMVAIAVGVVLASPAGARPRRARPARQTTAASKGAPFPPDQACSSAFRAAEASEQAGRLRRAKERLFLCAQPLCPRAIRHQCGARYTQIDAEIPSVVPVVQDESGAPRSDVQVAVDGEPLTSRLDGRALAVDPGLHRFTFSKDGEVIARQEVMIVQGQRNRILAVSWSAPARSGAAAPPSMMVASSRSPSGQVELSRVEREEATVARPAFKTVPALVATTAGSTAAPSIHASASDVDGGQPRRPRARRTHHALVAERSGSGSFPPSVASSPALAAGAPAEDGASANRGSKVLVVALGGVGLASLAGGMLLTLWGRSDNNQLSQCSPFCSESAVSHVRNMYLAADVALGVGVASLAGATWAYFSGRGPAEPRRLDTAYRFEIRPSAGGASALVRGTF